MAGNGSEEKFEKGMYCISSLMLIAAAPIPEWVNLRQLVTEANTV
jgi:hypothetical protein